MLVKITVDDSAGDGAEADGKTRRNEGISQNCGLLYATLFQQWIFFEIL